MFHGVIQKITLAQFFFETRCRICTCYSQHTIQLCRIRMLELCRLTLLLVIVGSRGSPGERGEPGVNGAPGDTGPTGFAGSIGIPGDQGWTGQSGWTGSSGQPGLKGIAGSTGFTGTCTIALTLGRLRCNAIEGACAYLTQNT